MNTRMLQKLQRAYQKGIITDLHIALLLTHPDTIVCVGDELTLVDWYIRHEKSAQMRAQMIAQRIFHCNDTADYEKFCVLLAHAATRCQKEYPAIKQLALRVFLHMKKLDELRAMLPTLTLYDYIYWCVILGSVCHDDHYFIDARRILTDHCDNPTYTPLWGLLATHTWDMEDIAQFVDGCTCVDATYNMPAVLRCVHELSLVDVAHDVLNAMTDIGKRVDARALWLTLRHDAVQLKKIYEEAFCVPRTLSRSCLILKAFATHDRLEEVHQLIAITPLPDKNTLTCLAAAVFPKNEEFALAAELTPRKEDGSLLHFLGYAYRAHAYARRTLHIEALCDALSITERGLGVETLLGLVKYRQGYTVTLP